MPRLKVVYFLVSLFLVAPVEARPGQKSPGLLGLGDVLAEEFDSHGLRWQSLVDFERAKLRIAGPQGLAWEQLFELDETLDLQGAPLPEGLYHYEWRVTVLSPEADEKTMVKLQSGRFQILKGIAQTITEPISEEAFPLATNTGGNHFVGNLTTDAKLCVGCPDGASADIVDSDGNNWEAVIRSKGFNPGIVLHETNSEIWMIDEINDDFVIVDLPSGLETGSTVPFRIADRAPTHSFRISPSGDLGSGTFVPLASLHVTRSDGTAELLVEEQSGTTMVRTQFQLWNNGAPRFALRNSDSGVEWSFQQSGPGNFLISKEGTGGPEFQVYQTGRVRMGRSGTANFDLDPNGNLTIKGSLTAGDDGLTFPDYVFEPDYALMPLSDLRSFIRQEKRLPNIPSAEEVKTQGGHNMTELQLKLLEKIEELTLYTLEQQRTIDRQQETINAQQIAIETLSISRSRVNRLEADLAEIQEILSDR